MSADEERLLPPETSEAFESLYLLRTRLTADELGAEVSAARSFQPRLCRFTLATSGPRDAKVQKRARELSEPGFRVEVWSWDDIWHELSRSDVVPALETRSVARYGLAAEAASFCFV